MSTVNQIVVLSKKLFSELSTQSFQVKFKGRIVRGFVVRRGKVYYAYLNRCQHLPVTLDLNDNEFFTHDKKYLQCHMHGAVYEIDSGLCVGGPCQGASLIKLKLEEEEDEIVVTVPAEAQ
ncbi:MAG: Rieske 2Fe-2S domain-containing protein [Bdellovibrionales bacterium]|nr:Rieske 2Fe-2S domain-containing protein [Bdellovibrionales bacterium]